MNGSRVLMMSAMLAASIALGTTSSSAINLPQPAPASTIEQSAELAPILMIGDRGSDRSMMKRGHGGKKMKHGHRMMSDDMSRGRRSMRHTGMRDDGMRRSEMGSSMNRSRTMRDRRVTPQGNPASAGGSPRTSQ